MILVRRIGSLIYVVLSLQTAVCMPVDVVLLDTLVQRYHAYQGACAAAKDELGASLDALLAPLTSEISSDLTSRDQMVQGVFCREAVRVAGDYVKRLQAELASWVTPALLSSADCQMVEQTRLQLDALGKEVINNATMHNAVTLLDWLKIAYHATDWMQAMAAKLAPLTYAAPATNPLIASLAVDHAWARSAVVQIAHALVLELEDAWCYGCDPDRAMHDFYTTQVVAVVPDAVKKLASLGFWPRLARACKRLGTHIPLSLDEVIATDMALLLGDAYGPSIDLHKTLLTRSYKTTELPALLTRIDQVVSLIARTRLATRQGGANSASVATLTLLLGGLLAYRAHLADHAAFQALPTGVQVALFRARALQHDTQALEVFYRVVGSPAVMLSGYQTLVDRFTRGQIDAAWGHEALACHAQLSQLKVTYGAQWYENLKIWSSTAQDKQKIGEVLMVALEVLQVLIDHVQGNGNWLLSFGRNLLQTANDWGNQVKRALYTADGKVLLEFANNAQSNPFASLKAAALYAAALASPLVASRLMAALAPYLDVQGKQALAVQLQGGLGNNFAALEQALQKPAYMQALEASEPALVQTALQALQQKMQQPQAASAY